MADVGGAGGGGGGGAAAVRSRRTRSCDDGELDALEAGELHERGREPQDAGAEAARARWRRWWRVSSSEMRAASTAALYGFTAVAMGFLNKYALTRLPQEMVLLLMQMVATSSCLWVARARKIIQIKPCRSLSRSELAQVVPIVMLYNANVGFALAGLSHLSIPVYNVVKRMTPILVLAYKAAKGQLPSPATVTTVLITVSGCVIAGYGDLDWNPSGYLFALLSCALQASYLILVERSGANHIFSSTELLYYNATLSMPVCAVLAVVSGELTAATPTLAALGTERSGGFTYLLGLIMCLGAGGLLNWSLFLCTMHNSALTTTIVGVLKVRRAALLCAACLAIGAPTDRPRRPHAGSCEHRAWILRVRRRPPHQGRPRWRGR